MEVTGRGICTKTKTTTMLVCRNLLEAILDKNSKNLKTIITCQ